jgi:hypothetical protein
MFIPFFRDNFLWSWIRYSNDLSYLLFVCSLQLYCNRIHRSRETRIDLIFQYAPEKAKQFWSTLLRFCSFLQRAIFFPIRLSLKVLQLIWGFTGFKSLSTWFWLDPFGGFFVLSYSHSPDAKVCLRSLKTGLILIFFDLRNMTSLFIFSSCLSLALSFFRVLRN